MKKLNSSHNLVTLLVLCLNIGAFSQSVELKKYRVDQRAHWVSIIDDPELVQLFIDEFFLSSDINRIEVYDLNNNGFSNGDVYKTYPDEMIYHLDDPSDRVQKVMDSWEFEANFSYIGENDISSPEYLEAQSINKAGNAIVGSFIKGLNRNYKDIPVQVWFHRDENGMRFEMWGYNEDELKYMAPPPAFTMPDTVETYDMLHVYRADTLVISDTTFYDFLYIYKSVSDTLFLPAE
ncbi:hypothetical protein HQ585_14415 [candidate division KSB1 bacterium]|nr:hypothetical protein [candidate division KSB1 bacterium]